MNSPLVYIIILNWNGYKDTITCLESILQLEYSNYKVVICDNDSSDNSVSKIIEWSKHKPIKIDYLEYAQGLEKPLTNHKFSNIVLIETGNNLGFAGGNNIGIKYALLDQNCQYVWILNNDTIVDSKSLKSLVIRTEQDKDIGICGSRLLDYHDSSKVQAWGGAKYNVWSGTVKHIGYGKSAQEYPDIEMIEKSMTYVIGASMLVSRNFLEKIGLMNEKYFLYYEEIDWATRAKGYYKMAYSHDSIVYHKEGGSTDGRRDSCSYIADYHAKKSRLIFTITYYPLSLPLIYIRMFGAIFNRIIKRQYNRVIMILRLMLTTN